LIISRKPPSMSRLSRNVGSLTSHSPIGLQGLLRDTFTLLLLTSCEAHHAYFSKFPSLHPSLVQIFPSALCSQTLAVLVPPLITETKFQTHT
jgi:hypothetical protein